jgi:hypothetical protein
MDDGLPTIQTINLWSPRWLWSFLGDEVYPDTRIRQIQLANACTKAESRYAMALHRYLRSNSAADLRVLTDTKAKLDELELLMG